MVLDKEVIIYNINSYKKSLGFWGQRSLFFLTFREWELWLLRLVALEKV